MEWQPIETAPKDGTPILAALAWEDDDKREPVDILTIVWMGFRGGYWGMSGCSSISIQTDSDPSDSMVPLFWMPLPDLPQAERPKGA